MYFRYTSERLACSQLHSSAVVMNAEAWALVRDACQLSKLYAYNGLMLSSGTRIDGVDIDRPHRVIVVDNPTRTEHLVPVITVEDDGTKNTTRKYHRGGEKKRTWKSPALTERD